MQFSQRKERTLLILKSIWKRKDGSQWQNIGNGIEPYQRKSSKAKTNWISNPFESKEELSDFLQKNSKPFRNLFPGESKSTLTFDKFSKIWDEEFAENEIKTPLGIVRLGKNQKLKNFSRNDNRQFLIGNLKSNLIKPNLIIKFEQPHESAERPFVYLFVSSFKDEDNFINYVSTSISREGNEIVISSHERDISGIYRKMKLGKTLFINEPRSTNSPGSRVLDPAHDGDSLISESNEENKESQDKNDIEKSLLGFAQNNSQKSKQGLVQKNIIDKTGRKQTKWVRPGEVNTPIEKKREEAKQQRRRQVSLPNHSDEDKAKIEKMILKHKEFENRAREQRRVYGTGPMLPKPGLIMRVYATGKVNVGGMLAEIKKVAEDGKTIFAELTSGKVYSFPIDQLQFAKSELVTKRRETNEKVSR